MSWIIDRNAPVLEAKEHLQPSENRLLVSGRAMGLGLTSRRVPKILCLQSGGESCRGASLSACPFYILGTS